MKLIVIIGFLFVSLLTTFSIIILQNGKSILNDRLTQTCNLTLAHVSKSIKDDILLYYNSESDANDRSEHLGHIREAILDVVNENIDGLSYAGVIDRFGRYIAHNKLQKINERITSSDSTLFTTLQETFVRQNKETIEYIYPLYAGRDVKSRTYLGVTVIGFSREIILQPISRATRIIITATILIIIFAVTLLSFVAQRMTRQIDALVSGVRKVSSGSLSSLIPVLSGDELGHLAKEFNNMIVHLREKLQMQKFVSKLTVQMIRKGASELSPVGERRQVTLLFSDVRSFSSLTERLSAEEIVRLINIYLDLQARIVEENNGIVDKFMGDQIMALFVDDDQTDTAVHAAVEIQRSIHELNDRRRRVGEMVLNVGCGLNSGSAVMGNMGSANRLDYTVIGDVVNLASRLCAIARPGQIIVPREMISELKNEYATIDLDSVHVKGRSQMMDICEIDYDHAIIM